MHFLQSKKHGILGFALLLMIFLQIVGDYLIAILNISNESIRYILQALFFLIRMFLPSLFILKFNPNIHLSAFFSKKEKPILGFRNGIVFLCPAMLLSSGIALILNFIGLRDTQTSSLPHTAGGMAVYILLVCFISPIVEELFFRGIILKSLQSFGKLYAILFSAAIFSITHYSLYNLIYPFLVGCILAFIAFKYGIGVSIIIHIFNNFIALISKFSVPGFQIFLLFYLIIGSFVTVLMIPKIQKEVQLLFNAPKFQNAFMLCFHPVLIVFYCIALIFIISSVSI